MYSELDCHLKAVSHYTSEIATATRYDLIELISRAAHVSILKEEPMLRNYMTIIIIDYLNRGTRNERDNELSETHILYLTRNCLSVWNIQMLLLGTCHKHLCSSEFGIIVCESQEFEMNGRIIVFDLQVYVMRRE